MKIVLATVQTPFIEGGAEYLIRGLKTALLAAGHQVERISMPFRFSPPDEVERSLEIWAGEDFTALNGHQADLVICLQFPVYNLQHPRKVLWLMHQFRMVYDLWETPFCPENSRQPTMVKLRQNIIESDTAHLAAITNRYTIAKNVSARLLRYNGVSSVPLYHPPFAPDKFFCAEAENYIFAPSRLEQTKRQDLLIRAMPYVDSSITAVLCGDGGQRPQLEGLARQLGVLDRVCFLGHVREEEKWGLYAHCACVFFGPYDEDYGYVTLEAMLSAKAVITCSDSGGPLEFVEHEQTGLVVAPQSEEIARAIRSLTNKAKAAEMGAQARQHYAEMDLSWNRVVECLTSNSLCEGS